MKFEIYNKYLEKQQLDNRTGDRHKTAPRIILMSLK